MKSYVLSLVLKWVLPKGLEWLKDSEIAHQAEIDAWFAQKFPGQILQASEKALVHKAIPKLLEEATVLLEKYNDASNISEDEILEALLHVVQAIFA